MADNTSTSRRWLYVLTLLGAFIIVAIAGIRNAKKRAELLDVATADKLALMASQARFEDPARALDLLDSAYAYDTANALVGQTAFDLWSSSGLYPAPELIFNPGSNGLVGASEDGQQWLIEGNGELIRMEMGNPDLKTEKTKGKVNAVAIAGADRYAWGDSTGLQIRKEGQSAHVPDIRAVQLQFSPEGRYLACLSTQSIDFIDLDSLEAMAWDQIIVRGTPANAEELLVEWTTDEKFAAVLLGEGASYWFEMASGQVGDLPFLAGVDGPLMNLAVVTTEGRPAYYTVLSSRGNMIYSDIYVQGRWLGSTLPLWSDQQLPAMPGMSVFVAEVGRYDVVAEWVKTNEMELVGTERGAMMEINDGYARAVYLAPDGAALTVGHRLAGEGIVAADDRGRIWRWRDRQPLVRQVADSSAMLMTSPHFEGETVEFIDQDGRTTRWDLVKGLVSDKLIETNAALAAVGGELAETWAQGWKAGDDPQWKNWPAWEWLAPHRARLEALLPRDAGQAVTPHFKLSPDESSLLMVLRDDSNQRFYNSFLWLPFSTAKALEVMKQQQNPFDS